MDYSRLLKAIDFAAEAHKNQRRGDTERTPYINHPIGVAKLITDAGCNDIDIIISALLHDTVEDVGVSIDEIVGYFGDRVAEIVSQVTDDKSLDKVTRKKLQVENAPGKCHGAKMVKLADKLHNLSQQAENSPVSWSEERKLGYFVWAYHVVDGLRGTNEFLESKLDELFNKKLLTQDRNLLREQLESYYELLDN